MPTKLIRCSCDGWMGRKQGSAFQETEYKNGFRVHNSLAGGEKYRCTVCGTERGESGASIDPKKK